MIILLASNTKPG